MAPYPSGPLHIGNARMVILNDEYNKRYDGKLFLVFDDTIGSEEKFIVPEAYDLIKESLDWLGVKVYKILYKSDRVKIFYEYSEELIKKNAAYMCFCDSEKLRANRADGIECVHRKNSVETNLEEWRKMLEGKYSEGQVVLRLKTNMKDSNPAFRDRVLFRVVDRDHPRVGKKHKVWPLLEFSWAIDDHLLGITHIIRGKDLMIEDQVEEFIWNVMKWKKATFIHHGLLQIEELKLSKTQSRKAIESKEFSGWDDPRTWSMQSLKKRGIQPQAIRNFVIKMGLSLADVIVPVEILYSENRKIIDSKANRYFAVLDGIPIKVWGAPKINFVEANLHPDFPERGKRRITVNPEKIYIEKEDFKNFDDREVGLINLYTVRVCARAEFISKEIKFEDPKIHWVSDQHVKIKIVFPDGSVKEAKAEPDIMNAGEGDLIQLVRIGFCRVDKTGKEMVLYFTHK